MSPETLAERALFVAGPARGGTTLLARLLGSSSGFYNVFTNDVYEHRMLYDYTDHSGLCRQLLDTPEAVAADIVRALAAGISDGRTLRPVSAETTAARPLRWQRARRALGWPTRPGAARIPLAALPRHARVVLKSPELVFVAPLLAELLPEARFALTWRSVEQVTLSMWRKGRDGWYWAGWQKERDRDGRFLLPPTVHPRWADLWQEASDLQRCAIRAISYFDGLEKTRAALGERAVICSHAALCSSLEAAVDVLCRALPDATREELLAFGGEIDPARRETRLDGAQESELHRLPEIRTAFERIGGLFPELPRPSAS